MVASWIQAGDSDPPLPCPIHEGVARSFHLWWRYSDIMSGLLGTGRRRPPRGSVLPNGRGSPRDPDNEPAVPAAARLGRELASLFDRHPLRRLLPLAAP